MENESKGRISEMQTREMQKVILGVLKAIDATCKAHGLTYYLIAGTMLGAVRHRGFIPWDDDADVALPRPDYEMLVKHGNEWLPQGYEIVSGYSDPSYPYEFARCQDVNTTYILRRAFSYVGGVPVDVFPLDGMTANPLKRFIHYRRYSILKRIHYYTLRDPYKHGHGIDSLFIRLCQRIFSRRRLHYLADKVQKQFSYAGSDLVADHDNKPSRGILPKDVYGDPVPVRFEDTQLMGVAKPDIYLHYCYGNYMQKPQVLPPQNFRYLNLHKPYRQYLEEKGETL